MPRKSYSELSYLNSNSKTSNKWKYLHLIEEDKEVMCELVFADKELKKVQKNIAEDLLEIFQKKPQTNYNKDKIKKFEALINNLAKPEDEKQEQKKPTNWIIDLRNWTRTVSLKQSALDLKEWSQGLSAKTIRHKAAKALIDTKEWAKNFSFSAFAFKYHGWFTSLRLFTLRVDRFPIMMKVVSTKIGAGPFAVLAAIVRFGGLSYLINILFDLGIIINETFIQSYYDLQNEKKKMPADQSRRTSHLLKVYGRLAWGRFLEVIWEDRRIYRMANDIMWLTINAIGIFMSGPYFLLVNAMINVIGFGFDFCNDSLLAFFKYTKYSFLKDHFDKVVARQRFEIDLHGCNVFLMSTPNDNDYTITDRYHLYLYRDGNEVFYLQKDDKGITEKKIIEKESLLLFFQGIEFNGTNENRIEYKNEEVIKEVLAITSGRGHTIESAPAADRVLTDEEANKLEYENQLLTTIRDKLEEKRIAERNDNIRVVVSLGLLVVGMFLYFFPPAALFGLGLTGAGLALFFGSISVSLGPRLLEIAREFKKDVTDFFSYIADEKKLLQNTADIQLEVSNTSDITQELMKDIENRSEPEERQKKRSALLPLSSRSSSGSEDESLVKKNKNRLSFVGSRDVSLSSHSSEEECGDFQPDFQPGF